MVTLLSNEEVAAHFARLDKDGNGSLSPDEIMHVIRERMGFDESTARHMLDMFDTNQDGGLD